MSAALDFLLYCMGTSICMVSGAWAVRIMRLPKRPRPVQEDIPSPQVEGLAGRLHDFQEQRFAPLRAPTPGEPGGPRVVPPVRVLQPRSKPIVPPRQPPPLRKPKDVVVPFPARQPKDDDPTKKD